MDRVQFISEYIDSFGVIPDEEVISANLDSGFYQEHRPGFQQPRVQRYYQSGANELLDEIREITSGLANSAKQAIRNRDDVIDRNSMSYEFGLMAAIFLGKTALYMLFKHSISLGYDFSSI